MKDKECCGTCRYRKYEPYEYYCGNENSDYYSLESEYDDHCEDYERKE